MRRRLWKVSSIISLYSDTTKEHSFILWVPTTELLSFQNVFSFMFKYTDHPHHTQHPPLPPKKPKCEFHCVKREKEKISADSPL
jgi:hypothetical protein